jgi:hypothetical protein
MMSYADRLRPRVRVMRLSALAVSLFLLAGCMSSQRALFPVAAGAHPIEPGHYRLFQKEGDAFKPSDLVEVRNGAENSYDFVDEQGKTTLVSLHPIDGGRFVGQAHEKEGYAYVVFEISGKSVLVYAPDCDKQDKDRMAKLAVEISNHECKLDRIADAKAFFSTVDIGQPTSKMERE